MSGRVGPRCPVPTASNMENSNLKEANMPARATSNFGIEKVPYPAPELSRRGFVVTASVAVASGLAGAPASAGDNGESKLYKLTPRRARFSQAAECPISEFRSMPGRSR
jgi:hypothetical protein